MSSITRDVRIRKHGPFDHVIEVDMKQAAATLKIWFDINDMLHIKVAEQLGVLEHTKYAMDMVDTELRYYTYDVEKQQDERVSPLDAKYNIRPIIMRELFTKRYLLVVQDLDRPMKPIELNHMTEDLWIPAPLWTRCFWILSTTSQDVYDRSKPDYDCVVESFAGDDILILTLHSLKQAAKYISTAVGHGEEKYWHHVALQCFHYATMLLLIPHSSNVDPSECDAQADVSSDVLIRQWAAQGILPVIKPSVQERIMGEDTDGHHCQYYGDDIYQVGNIILEAFREYSLLQLPFSPATEDDGAIISAACFLAYHSLVVEPLTSDELCEGNHSQLEHMQCISHVGDQGWHVSRDWWSQGSSGPTTLTIRHCSQQSRLFMKLESDDFLAKLPCLRVLDISYTPIESLPPSICCLQKLQLLSLRGCYNLRSPFSFPDTEITLCENNTNKKLNLLYLDLSYSNINTFQCDFFHKIPKELLLVKCSNLEELPPSALALSSLTKLELIDNKKLISFSRLTEIALDGHGNLNSFSLVGTPHIKRLSLHGCSKLESVDIKEVDALEELDLSATAIKELPDNIPNLPKLKCLLLRGVPSLRRFPWHKLRRLPDVFCLDQCSDGTVNHHYSPEAAQVCISDSRLFYSFNDATRNLVIRRGRLLKSFYVQVTSCKATTREIQDGEDMVKTNKLHASLAAYANVHRGYLTDGVSMMSMDDVPPFRETERHVEISAVERYQHGLKHLLEVIKSISMSDDTHVSGLNDLSGLEMLEECKLQRCHRMMLVFDKVYTYLLGQSLKNAHAKSRDARHPLLLQSQGNFLLQLPFLYFELPCLRRIHLQELPLLEHLRDEDVVLTAPAWEELHVRGCWSLRRLPRLDQRPGKKAVTVSGERAWWTKLRWDRHNSHRGSYEPRLPPASASIRERVVIKTYLR
ncbi:LOW QUALITY PROTEIN: hypothetical protein PAHAL_7G133700 [Panicum hallii]|uniref:NB-ARC domain-containing protein n=1 Tax=Panicum hallii TaxID=206008 RepID=A0A2T8IC46_9POAL|nr:LOW QUALITY PROTEIN: hypothetical protein PAHAL_7G133700 [Panicum hallii]